MNAIVSGTSDTTSDFSISALTTAGVTSLGSTLAVTGISTFNAAIRHVGTTEFGGQRKTGWVSNVGLNLSAGTLKLVQGDGSTDFSATAPGFCTIPSATAGAVNSLQFTATDFLFVDDAGSSDIIGVNFGTDSTEAWDEQVPFYLYAVNGDGTDSGIEFAISRNPTSKHSPATAQIAFHGTIATSDNDETFFFLTSTDVTATHNAKPVLLIGGFTMNKSVLDDWTIASLDESKAQGILPHPHQDEEFNMAEGQNGALAASFLFSSGVVPTWATPANIVYKYRINTDGWVDVAFYTNNAGAASQTGQADALSMVVPYRTSSTYYTGTSGPSFPIYIRETGGADGIHWARLTQAVFLLTLADPGGTGALLESDFSDGLDDIEIILRYKAY